MNNDLEFDSLIKKMAAEHQPELPSPGVIWWRAQILKKQAERERVERPLNIMRLLAMVLCLVVVVGFWLSEANAIRGIFSLTDLFSFQLFLIVGAALGIAYIGVTLWSTTRFKNQS